jgi:RHH-type proline utilization regulon transcriptional repressor/proline dehydrogenase/delta 1-pyrroline-5-carboxylate dehydrogenase
LAQVEAGLVAAAQTTAPSDALILPGPTGESNRLTAVQRAPLVCLGPGASTAMEQARRIRELGGQAVEAPGLPAEALLALEGFSGALHWGTATEQRPYAQALAQRSGPILPLIARPDAGHVRLERHVCIDTTASGGNAQLLAQVSGA